MTDTERPDPDHDPQNDASGPGRSGDGYETGYGKPPQATRFRKGQSGNPRGRPRGARNMRSILKDALNGKVPVSDGGRRRMMTRMELLIHKLIAKAAAGDMRALLALMAIVQKLDGDSEGSVTEAVLSPQDRETMDRALKRMGYVKQTQAGEADNDDQH